MSLTAKELAAIEDQLGVEQTLIKKFTMYAHMASDPQLRTQFENLSLYTHLDVYKRQPSGRRFSHSQYHQGR